MRRWLETEDPGLVPTRDPAAQMASLFAAAMAFVSAVILAFALTAARTASDWEASVAPGLTVELPFQTAPARTEAVVAALADLPRVEAVSVMDDEEKAALLSPWLGDGVEIASLRLPVVVEVLGAVDADGAREAATGILPQAVVADHADWRDPVVTAACRMRLVALAALVMATATAGGIVWLAVSASVARGGRTVEVLRLVGAGDAFIASRFSRPFALRAAAGAAAGTFAAFLVLILVRLSGVSGTTEPGPVGYEWFLLLAIPLVTGALAWIAARLAVARTLAAFR